MRSFQLLLMFLKSPGKFAWETFHSSLPEMTVILSEPPGELRGSFAGAVVWLEIELGSINFLLWLWAIDLSHLCLMVLSC